MLGVGLMSGTSLDGVDAALVRFGDRPDEAELVAFRAVPYEPAFRARVLDAIHRGTARDLATLHVELGRRFADAALGLLHAADVAVADVAFVASHGQTLWHEPGVATLQLGDPAVIAEQAGIRVVSDFRSRDVAAGGQGAPLVPIADALLFGAVDHDRALLNIGGIANVTWVPRRGVTDGVMAFDTGPGVAVMDGVVRRVAAGDAMDRDGRRARRGTPDPALGTALLRNPYFDRPPPKSTGRELFGEALAGRIVEAVAGPDDAVATALDLTVRSIAEQLTRWLPRWEGDLVVSGGGARNPVLMERLRAAMPGREVRLFSDLFFDGDAKEAVAFALLGWLRLREAPGSIPGATGARGARVLGVVSSP